MHLSRTIHHSTSIQNVSCGSFWDTSCTNVILLRDRRLEFRSIERNVDRVGEVQSWLDYHGEQEVNYYLRLSRTLKGHHPQRKDLDSLLVLCESGEVIIFSFSFEQQKFLSVFITNTSEIVKKPHSSNPCLEVEAGFIFSFSNDAQRAVVGKKGSQTLKLFRLEENSPVKDYKEQENSGLILSANWLAPNPVTGICLLSVLLHCHSGTVMKFWNVDQMMNSDDDDDDSNPVLTMPIPTGSQWMKDYGSPLSLIPIQGHQSAVAVICEKGICILDFRALSIKTPVDALVLKDLPLLYPSNNDLTSLEDISNVPVQLLYEHFFKFKNSRGDQLDHLWDTFFDEKQKNEDSVRILLSTSSPSFQQEVDGEVWTVMELYLILEDKTLHCIQVSYRNVTSHTSWKFDFSSSKFEIPIYLGMKLNCLPEGNLFLTSLTDDHVLLSPCRTEENKLIFNTVQVFGNSGPITNLLLRQNLPKETGRVFFAISEQEIGGCVNLLSSGLMTEELCSASHFSGLTNFWKITPILQTQLPPILVLSFLQQSRALALKNGSFSDVTNDLGLLEDEQTVFCSSFNEGFMIQVTPSRVGLFSLRHLEMQNQMHTYNQNRKQHTLHYKHPSSTSLVTQQDRTEDLVPRRWSFNVLNSQFGSTLQNPEKQNAEIEAAESVWSLKQYLGPPEKTLRSPKGLLDLNLWTKSFKKKDKGPKIALASSCEDTVVLFLTIECSLVFLGAEKGSQNLEISHPRKKIKSTIQLKSLCAIKLKELHPSCIQLMKKRDQDSELDFVCFMGTYHPSLEVFLLQKRGQNYQVIHLSSILGDQLYDPLISGFRKGSLMENRPIPESIVFLDGSTQNQRSLFIGFRNGELAEYQLNRDLTEITLLKLRQIGALPVKLESIIPGLLLAYSNRSYLIRRRKDVNGRSLKTTQIKQINLPSNVGKCVGFNVPKTDTLMDQTELKFDLDSILAGFEDQQLLFVFSDLVDTLFVSFIPREITKIKTQQPLKKLIQLPQRDQVLGITGESTLVAINIQTRSSRVIYSDPKNDWIKSLCLWPPPPSMESLPTTTTTCSEPEKNHQETQEVSKEPEEQRTSSHSPSEILRMNFYFKRVKFMAAALTCCSTFRQTPMSTTSTPRVEMNPSPEPVMTEIYLTLGTGNDRVRPSLTQQIRRGSLKVLKLKIKDKDELGSWVMEEVATRHLPDAVEALAVVNQDFMAVTLNHRLVIYRLIDQSNPKVVTWLQIRDPVTSLTCRDEVVLTGDQFNGIVVYNFAKQSDREDSEEELKHSFSTPYRSSVVAQGVIDEDTYAMIETSGNFVVLKRSTNPKGRERNLQEISKLRFGTELTSMISVLTNNGVTEFFNAFCEEDTMSLHNEGAFVVSTRRGALYIVHERPKELELKNEEEEKEEEGDSKDLENLFLEVNQKKECLTHSDLDAASDDLYFCFS